MAYLAYAIAWMSTAAAVVAGVYFTHSAWCLWAFLLPAGIDLKYRRGPVVECAKTDKDDV